MTRSGELDFLGFVDFAVAEAQQRVPRMSAGATELILLLNRLAMQIVYDLESSVHRPSGWSWSGFRVLFTLWLAGELDAKTAARLSGMSRAALSSVANTLVDGGLVHRSPHGADGRSVLVALTETGEREVREVFERHNAREQAWAAALTDTERDTLVALLRKLAFRADEPWVRHRG